MDTIEVIIISGRSGSGKSSVANEIHRQLCQLSIRHASIEGDNLDMVHPEQTTPELFLANLTQCWRNFVFIRDCRTLILNGTAVILDHQAIRRVIQDVSPDADVRTKSFILQCSDESIERRLSRRETGSGLQEHLERSRKMTEVLAGLDQEWIEHLETDGLSVPQVAEAILHRSLFSQDEEME